MSTQKRQASVLGSTLTSLTLNSDLSSSEEETSETDDEDFDDAQQMKASGESAEADATDNEKGKNKGSSKDKEVADLEVKKSEKPSKPRVRMKTLTIDGQLVYFCVLCDKVFTRRKDKLNHELAHSSETVLTCTECGKEYFHESSLAYHMRSHDADQLHLCDLCPKMFAQGHHLKTHILSHSQPTEFTCKTCYQDFALASDLSEHVRNKIKEEVTVHWCKMCKIYFCRNHSDIKIVSRLHAHRCTACNELFYSHKKLRLHMKKYAHKSFDKPKVLEPLAAEEIYSQRRTVGLKKGESNSVSRLTAASSSNIDPEERKRCLDNNENNKPPSKRRCLPFKCHGSEAVQSSSSIQDSAPEVKAITNLTLKSPYKGRKGKPYCKKCNKSFKDVSDLDSHKLLAHGETPKYFPCEICQQRFPSQQQCDNHKAQHRREEMHTCPMCCQDFFHSAELTQHLKEHSGDFPYKCNQCGKSFRLKLQLIQHIRLHIPQTPVACDKCGLQVSCRKDLDEHLLQAHDEEEEFKCHLCSKVFQFRYKLQNHLRLHTNVKTFQCYICHKSFATKYYLQRHLQIHLRQGMDVDMTNIIKKEKEDIVSIENMTNDESEISGNWDMNEKEELQNSVSSTHQNFKKFTENDHRRFRSKDNVVKLNFRKVQDDMTSDSEESACSVLTRESEKSDPFRFSSDGSDSFKFTMAKERRRLRKRRQLSRLALYNKLNALTNEQFDKRQVEIVASETVIEEDDESETVRDLTVEINGIESLLDNEVTIFVDLKEVKPSPELSDLATQKLDLTDKENQLPGHTSILQHLDTYSRARIQCDDQTEENDGQTLVLDIEMDDESLNEFFNQNKKMVSEKCLSDMEHTLDPIKSNLKDSCNLLSGVTSFQDNLSQQKPDDISPARSTFVSGKHQNSPCIVDNQTSSDPNEYTDKPTMVYRSEKNDQPTQTSMKSIQPLQSLHDMTVQIQGKGNGTDMTPQIQDKRHDNQTNLLIQGKVKHDRKKTPNPNRKFISKERLNNNVECMPKSQGARVASPAHNFVNKPWELQSQKSPKSDSVLVSKGSSIENHAFTSQNIKAGVPDSGCKSKREKECSAWTVSPSVPKSHMFISPSIPSAISHSHTSSHNSGTLLKVDQPPEAISLPLKGNFIMNSTSPFPISEPQKQAFPIPPTSSLCHGNERGHDLQLTGNMRGATPKEFQPLIITNSPSRSCQLNIVPSSQNFSPGAPSVCGLSNVDSPKTPPRVSSNLGVTSRLSHCNSPRSSVITDSLSSGQIFDTKNPTLRNINMMELVASNNSGTTPQTPAPMFAGPNLNVNTCNLQENQNMNAIASFLRPVTPSPILPPQLGSLSSTTNFYPECTVIPPKSNPILVSDIPHPSLANNPDLSLLNNFGNFPPTLGSMGPPSMSLNLDMGLSNLSGFGPISNFSHVNTTNQGMAGQSLPLPVSNFRGLDPMPLANINPNPLPFCNMDLMANMPSAASRPMNNINPVNLLSFGGTCLNPVPNGISPLNSNFNIHPGAILPPGIGSSGIPVASSNLLSNPQVPLGTVNFPLSTPLMPESGILPAHPMGIMGGMNSGPFFPMYM